MADNNHNGVGSVDEAGGLAIIETSSDPNQSNGVNNNTGIVSLGTFSPGIGFKVRWEIAGDIEGINSNGVGLTVQSESGFLFDETGVSLNFRGDNQRIVVYGTPGQSDQLYNSALPLFTPGTIDDFVVTGEFNPDGWSYRIEGFEGLTDPHTISGAWTANHNFSTLFDNGLHVGAFIQTDAGGTTMTVDRITVFSAVPEPSTWALAGLGLLGVAALARRRRTMLSACRAASVSPGRRPGCTQR